MKPTFLSHFTPSLMKPEDLEAIFVQREDLAQRLVELIKESALTSSKHHTLLIGPRGIGKTHLIALTYHRIQKLEDLHDHLLIAWLREEEWGISSFLDLLLRILRALQEEYNDPELTEQIEILYELSPEAAEHAAAELLKNFTGDRTLLLLIENLDDLFAGLGDEGQKRLRAYLQENPFCTILATSQSLFNGISLQTSPFYGFFRIHHLQKLGIDEAIDLLTKVAKRENDQELVSFIQKPIGRARIRAVHHLAGGNHRVYVIFSDFLNRQSLNELVEPLLQTLDELTPYYQARMKWLSLQQRKIVEFLCDCRYAVSVKEIAKRCFTTHQTASSQLKSLRDMGYVRSSAVGRESYYELQEPLMRLSIEIKKNRGEPIRLLVDFLRFWHSRDELQQLLDMAQPEAALEREYLLHALKATEEETEDPRMTACLRDFEAFEKAEDLVHGIGIADELIAIRGHDVDWARKGFCLVKLERFEEALKSFDKAIELNPNNLHIWGLRGETLHDLGHLKEALASFDKVIELDSNCALGWRSRGIVLFKIRRHEDALGAFDKAIELKINDVWFMRGSALFLLRRYEEALRDFKKVIELEPKKAIAWSLQGLVLSKLKHYKKALASFEKAIELDDKSPHSFLHRSELLLILDRWDEGITALDDALQRCAYADELYLSDTNEVLAAIFLRIDYLSWRIRSEKLIKLYAKHKALSALGHALVLSISVLTSKMISDSAAKKWLSLWQELAGDYKEFQLPLRLLNATVRYRETQDPRILLKLPAEERDLLEQVLEEGESLNQ